MNNIKQKFLVEINIPFVKLYGSLNNKGFDSKLLIFFTLQSSLSAQHA